MRFLPLLLLLLVPGALLGSCRSTSTSSDVEAVSTLPEVRFYKIADT